MTDPTPLYRNLVHERAVAEGCPEEVTKEAWAEMERRYEAEFGIDDGIAAEMIDTVAREPFRHAVAYGYTAGRVARWDALVKGSPRLMDAILRQVHEFFHDEPFGQHDGTAGDCTDCPTVAALAADAAAAYYSAGTHPVDPDLLLAALGEPEGEGDLEEDADYDEYATSVLPVVTVDTVLGPLPSALHTSAPDEWRASQ